MHREVNLLANVFLYHVAVHLGEALSRILPLVLQIRDLLPAEQRRFDASPRGPECKSPLPSQTSQRRCSCRR